MTSSSKMLLDSDTLSLYFKKNPNVISEAQSYLVQHKIFTFSIITRFEILRGLKAKNAHSQIRAFNFFCSQNEVLNLNDQIIVRAANIYAKLRQAGLIIGDADILIGATALENNLALVTNNQNHFNRIADLQLLNWNN